MSNKFKVGDMVRVYGFRRPSNYVVICGTVSHINDDILSIEHKEPPIDHIRTVTAHYKQCRRLKPKKKPRYFWIKEIEKQHGFSVAEVICYDPLDPIKYLHVQEVLK